MDALEPVRALLPGTRLDELEVLSDGERATVSRVRARDEAHGDRTLVVKRFHGAGEEWVRECAMLACLPDDAPAPRLIAESAESQLAVLTDLGGGSRRRRARGVADRLLADDAAVAGEALVRWARALATLHAGTAGLRDRFVAELDARAGDLPVTASPMRAELAASAETLSRHCASLGVPMPAGSRDELARLGEHTAIGPCALTPHDTCPDNNVAVGADGLDVALIDFEGAQWRNVAWDVAYLLVPWPTCWCSWALPAWASGRALEVYREIAGVALPDVAGDGFAAELEIAVVGWTVESAALMMDRALAGAPTVTVDEHPAPPRRSALLHRLDIAHGTTALPALAELAGRLAAELRGRWGDVDPLPLAPAFRGRSAG